MLNQEQPHPKPSRLKKYLRITLGILFLILGVIGLVLPILQGILFIFIGLLLLAPHSRFIRVNLEKLQRKYPALFRKAQGFMRRKKIVKTDETENTEAANDSKKVSPGS